MDNYSKTQVYKNGNKVIIGDHTEVRELLRTGIVNRVSNFGPLLHDRQIIATETKTCGNFELHIVYKDEVSGFAIGTGIVTEKGVNNVYYQRITK